MECISIESELAPHKDVCCVMHFFLINITVKRGHSTNGIIFISLKCPKKKPLTFSKVSQYCSLQLERTESQS